MDEYQIISKTHESYYNIQYFVNKKDNFTIFDSDITKRRMKYGWIQNY